MPICYFPVLCWSQWLQQSFKLRQASKYVVYFSVAGKLALSRRFCSESEDNFSRPGNRQLFRSETGKWKGSFYHSLPRPSLSGPSLTRSHQSYAKENSSGVEDVFSNRGFSNAVKWYTPIYTHLFSFCLLVFHVVTQKSLLVSRKSQTRRDITISL